MSDTLKRKSNDVYTDSRKRFIGSLATLEEPNLNMSRQGRRTTSEHLMKTHKPPQLIESILNDKCTLSPVINLKEHKKSFKSNLKKQSPKLSSAKTSDSLAKTFQKISKIQAPSVKAVQTHETFTNLYLIEENKVLDSQSSEFRAYDECCTPVKFIKVPSSVKRLKISKHKSKIELKLIKLNKL